MHSLTEEHTWRTVQLRYYNALSTIDDKRAVGSHIRDCTKEHVLDKCAEVLMLRVRTVKFHFSLQGYAICKTALEALIDRVAWRVNIVIQELKNEIITCIGYREVF